MTTCTETLLERAVAERLNATLSIPTAREAEYPVRLLTFATDRAGLWIQPVLDDDRAIDLCDRAPAAPPPMESVVATGTTVQVAMVIHRHRHAFRSRVLRREPHFWFTDTLMFDALLLEEPGELFSAERRAHPRLQVPDRRNVFAQIVCPSSPFPLQVRPWDVSAGGVCFLCPRHRAVLQMSRDAILQFSVSYMGRRIAGKAALRSCKALTGRVTKIGLRFVPDSLDRSSRENLDHCLADLTRFERQCGRPAD